MFDVVVKPQLFATHGYNPRALVGYVTSALSPYRKLPINFCGKDRYLYLRICTEMDNNAPNMPATKPHKAKMKHTYLKISFGGGRVILVLPICLLRRKIDTERERERHVSVRKSREKTFAWWAETHKKNRNPGKRRAPNFAREKGEETALRGYSSRKTTKKYPTRVHAFTRCVFPRRVMRVLSNLSVVWSLFLFPLTAAKRHIFYKRVDKTKCARGDRLATRERSKKRSERVP